MNGQRHSRFNGRRQSRVLETINLPIILEHVAEAATTFYGRGKLPEYIPELAEIEPNQFGMAITTVAGEQYTIGDVDVAFSIQSISKLLALILAMNLEGESLWSHVGREPSGTRFNSLVQLEYEQGIPRNPFINAGALVTLDRVLAHVRDYPSVVLDFARFLSMSDSVAIDSAIVECERQTGHTNYALAYLLRSFRRIEAPVTELLAAYFHQCALSMTCRDLSRAFVALANGGLSPILEEAVVTARHAKRINSLMLTSGMYDSVGNFAYRVGLPAKSGVGGGIVAIVPGHMCIAVWSPELDLSGNSVVGVRALETFSEITGLSIF
ncbi:glutaminase [Methylonatrum kenyense]|uniref:glutaminase n=1 Tax=Methylonatrum kenyense TaxID=455253 RepID=UPI0020C178B5|nr:glutaminase [Methylonatrum kenyense]MCK8514715.1 glutaminase [Methylonatrum kenyense]